MVSKDVSSCSVNQSMSTSDDLEDALSVEWGLPAPATASDADFKAEIEMKKRSHTLPNHLVHDFKSPPPVSSMKVSSKLR